jgi:predicted metal-dependent hydrolase
MVSKEIHFHNIKVKITYKKIKNIILKVKNISEVEISCHPKTQDEKILKFVSQKQNWINESFKKISKNVNLNEKLHFSSGEFHFFLGKRYPLKIVDSKEYKVILENEEIILEIPEATSKGARERLLYSWYLIKLKDICEDSFEKWEQKTKLFKNKLSIEKMKGKWGYCNYFSKNISINIEIIKKDLDFIDYVILHEICHLQVPNHGIKFKELLGKHLPNWKEIQKID